MASLRSEWSALGRRRVHWVEDGWLTSVDARGRVVFRERVTTLQTWGVTRDGRLRVRSSSGGEQLLDAVTHRDGTRWGQSLLRFVPPGVLKSVVPVGQPSRARRCSELPLLRVAGPPRPPPEPQAPSAG